MQNESGLDDYLVWSLYIQVDSISEKNDDKLELVNWQRKGSVLTRPKLPCLGAFHTINLSAGCPNRCRYCYAQTYAQHPGWGKVAFYANAREKLKSELARMREAPRLVYFSTASDPFVPAEQLLADLFEIMAMLLDCGAVLIISTKCTIPQRFMELFARHQGKVHVQIGITTVDDGARGVIEPGSASVEQRLSNLRRLAEASISHEARVDPLVPGLTDTNENMQALIEALALENVSAVVASFLFLRWGIEFPDDLAWGNWNPRAMRKIYTLKISDYCGGGTIWLPQLAYRTDRFDALRSIARANGIRFSICHCKNTDDGESSCCHPAELLLQSPDSNRQLTLF